MTDPDMTRFDWMNDEASGAARPWQLDHDGATAQDVCDLCNSLIAIGPAVSRSELETTLAKLREEYAWNDDLAFAITQITELVEHYHGLFMARRFDHEGLADELRMALEDVAMHAGEDQ